MISGLFPKLCLAALLAVLITGCQTTSEPPVIVKVTRLTNAPVIIPARTVEANPPVVVVVTSAPPVVVTNPPVAAPPAPVVYRPTNAWVILDEWAAANRLGKPQKLSADRVAITTPTGVAVFQFGRQELRWDGVDVWLGYAPKLYRGCAYVHAMDIEKTIQPLMVRPARHTKPGRIIVLDPGHGGMDGGTHGTMQQLEKNYALDWAYRIRSILVTNGWTVYMTRTNDVNIPLTNRIAFADQVNANVFVSLHFNGLSAASAHSGIETFCMTPQGMASSVKRNMDDPLNQDFFNNRYDRENIQYAFRIHRELINTTKATDGGLRRARFITVLRNQQRPAVLVEGGFLSNAAEAKRIATPEYRQKLAQAVAKALE